MAIEVWFELSEIEILKRFDNQKLRDFFDNFEFIKIARKYHINFIIINKIAFVLEAIQYLNIDLKNLSEILDFNGFEALVQEILIKNNYNTTRNFRFSDKSNFKSKTKQVRYEIDVIGIHRNNVLIIDAKQWKRKDSFMAMNKAANLQYQRTIALEKNPDAFFKLIQKILGITTDIKLFLPFKLIPVMISLEDSHVRINENQIPLVSLYNFNSFLQELPITLRYFKTIEIKSVQTQTQLV